MQFAVRTTHGFCPPLDSAHSTPFDQQLRPDPDHRSTTVVALFTSQLHCLVGVYKLLYMIMVDRL